MTTQNPSVDIWCKEFFLERDANFVAERNKRFSSFCDDVKADDIESLTRLAFKTKPSQAIVRKLEEAFFDGIGEYTPGANARELQVLAGALLAAVTERADKLAILSATSVLCASFSGLRKPELPVDLVGIACAAYDKMSLGARTRREVKRAIPAIKADVVSPMAAMAQSFNAQSVADALKAVSETIAASTTTALRAATAQPGTSRVIAALEEEVQILWWLIGAWSDDLECEFSHIPEKARALVLSVELAALTRTYPGPRSIPGLLGKAGVTRNSNRIDEAVDSLTPSWIKVVIDGHEFSPVLTPIHFALQRRDETAGEQTWHSGWAGATGLNPSTAVQDIDLGMQLYRERTLLAQR